MRRESVRGTRTSNGFGKPGPARALVLFSVAVASQLSPSWTASRAENLELSSRAREQIQILQAEKLARTPAQRKLDSQIHHALLQRKSGAVTPRLNALRSELRLESDERMLVDIRATVTPGLLQFIESGGGQVVNQNARYNSIRARVTFELVEQLAARPEVRSLRPADEAITNTGGVTSGGDVAHRADEVRNAYGVSGAGIKIGVLSDSVDHLALSQAAGELPVVTILPGQAGTGTGEGTAMLEIIHDLAPGAELYFATAFAGMASFAQNIRDLHAAGCRIIVDDVTYFAESPLQDDLISQAVNDVSAAGTLFFSSAGNGGSKLKGTSGTWEGDFKDGGSATLGAGGRVHDFGGLTYNTVVPGGAFTRLDLFWADPLGASTNDYDVYVVNSSDQVVRSSTNVQDGDDDPYESLPFVAIGERVVIVKSAGADRFLSLMTLRGRLAISTSGSVRGHNASGASNAFSVAAARVSSPPAPFDSTSPVEVEPFSSDGPRRMFFNPDGSAITPGDYLSTGGVILDKPDITAADGVATSVPGFANFLGTSAAAPHAGAIAALLWEHKPLLAPAEVRAYLAVPALDIESVGTDNNAGSGIIMADQTFDPRPRLALRTVELMDANANGGLDANECADLIITLENVALPTTQVVTGITAVLTSSTPGVTVDPLPRSYVDLGPGQSNSNVTAFRLSTARLFDCGTNADFVLQVGTSNQLSFSLPFQLQPGMSALGPVIAAASTNSIPIPDLGIAESQLLVTNMDQLLEHVRVGVYLTHSFDYDLRLSLISPEGIEVVLSVANGGDGQDYGESCDSMTLFSDDAITNITEVTAPFVGIFKPKQALSAFHGKSGDAVNGWWTLRVRDEAALDAGTLWCWKLELSPLACVDGGGQCLVPPVIVRGPVSQTVTEGDTVQFSVQAEGTLPLAYQWSFAPATNLAANNLAIATNSSLTLSNVSLANAGTYWVTVSNRFGQQLSLPASLTVQLRPLILCGTNRAVPLGASWEFDAPFASGDEITVDVLSTTTNAGCGDGYSVTRTWMASDPGGRQATCSQTITLLDTRLPTIECAPDFVVSLGVYWAFDVPSATAAGAVSAVVYDNSVNDLLYRFDPGTNEVGDEIILDGPARQVEQFAFEFWGAGTNDGGFTGDVQARLRFYQNDGPLSPSGYATPGTLLFDSGPFPIPAVPRATVVFEDFQVDALEPLTLPLPESFTWTVQFSGLQEGDSAGLDLYSPPPVGNNYTDYWERENEVWVLKTNPVGSMDFAARLVGSSRGVNLSVFSTVTNMQVARDDSYLVSRDAVLNVPAPGVLANDLITGGDALTAVLETGPVLGTLNLNSDGGFVYTPGSNSGSLDVFTYRVLRGGDDSDSAAVHLWVSPPDISAPTLDEISVMSANVLKLVFSEPVASFDAETITHYQISNGIAILAAKLGEDARTVFLTTSGLPPGSYLVTVNNVTDLASPPNTIAPNTEAAFNSTSSRVSAGLVTLYGFQEGAGTNVHDVSGVGAPLDLGVLDPAGIEWIGGGTNGLRITSPTAIRSSGAADKLHAALASSNRLTLEVWAAPASLLQEGPARIVTLSGGTSGSDVNFHLGQEFTNVSYRLRTAENEFSWMQSESVFQDTNNPTHLVVTYDGTLKRLFVNGVEQATSEFLLGDFSNWDATYPFLFGNEATLDRPWLGSLYLAAIYDRDLLVSEIQQNYLAGPTLNPPGTNSPPVAIDDSYVVGAGAILQVSAPGLLGNDADAEGDLLTVLLEAGASHGALNLNWDGSFVYAPNNGYAGPDSFSYRVSDGLTSSAPAVVQLTVVGDASLVNSTVVTRTWQAVDDCGNSAWCSQSVTIVDTRPPDIAVQPQSRTAIAGDTVILTLSAIGAAPLSYQWYFNETNLLWGATDSELELTQVQAEQAGSYSATVSNSFGRVTSAVATLIVWERPAITQQPVSLLATQGQSAHLTVTANGTEPLTYQWFFNGSPVFGALDATFVLTEVQSTNSGGYFVVVTNWAGSVTSQVAAIFLGVPGLLCGEDRTEELGAIWDFDTPLVFRDVALSVLATLTNHGCGQGYSVTRTWQARDTNGVEGMCSQTITVLDSRTPTLVCGPDKSVPLGSDWSFDPPLGRAAGAVASIVYDNSQTDLSQRFDPGLSEVGDEISLSEPAEHVGQFTFGFWGNGTNAGVFTGNVQARLRFYNNDGPISASGHAGPGTLLFDSGPFSIPATPRATARFEDFQIDALVPLTSPLPSTFTWTVQFSGLEPGDAAGLDLFSPPAIGNNRDSRWKRDNTGWVEENSALPTDFAARLQALSRGVVVTEIGTVTNGPVGNTTAFTRSWQATDECGNSSTCSQTVTVVDMQPPVIAGAPQSQTVDVGGDVDFTVSATGAAPLSFQWFFNETNKLAGATGASLLLTNVQATNNGLYLVVVSNAYGTATSAVAALNVISPPWIISQPGNQNVSPGDTASFAVVALAFPPPAYQWLFNETNLLADATDSTFVITNAQDDHAGLYSVVITNSLGSVTSQLAQLTLGVPAFIAIQPQTFTALPGQTAAFTVTPGGTPPFAFQWYLACASPLAGATAPTLILTNVSAAENGSYCVLVSNSYGAAFSHPALLRVLTPPDAFFIARSNSVVTITFSTVTNQFYTVQYIDDLNAPAWSALRKGVHRPGTGFPIVLQDLQAPGAQRFYRILIE